MRPATLTARNRMSRLIRMPATEIQHRLREAVRIGVDRVAATPGPPDTDGKAALRYLQEVAARRFYLPADRQGWRQLRHALETHIPSATPRAIVEAEALVEGSIPVLGRRPVGPRLDVDWHRDPFTGARWPVRFWADYDLVAADNVADPKGVHEINRHQYLPRLALAFALTGRERFARRAIHELESWIDQNPPGMGINWASSLEIALRTISWMWTIFPLLAFDAIAPPVAARLLASICDQLRHVHRYTSVYSSPNTHLLGEATALFVGGVILAEMEGAEVWRETGRRLLVDEIDRQVLADGAHAELSSYYHCYSLDFYLQALILARRNGIPLNGEVSARVLGQADFLRGLTRADGTIPLLGDDDGGRALALDRQDYRTFTDGLSTAAVLFERPDLAAAAGGLHPETLWLLGPDAVGTFTAIAEAGAHAVAPAGKRFPDAGYCIQRAGTSHLVFDGGGLGRLGGGHGHADALAVVLHSGSTEMLVDPGTCVYNLEPAIRDHFRSTRAHNTLVVDEEDQAVAGGTFGWASDLTARIVDHQSWPGLDVIEGEHDGYRRLPGPVVHRRRVLMVDNEYWLLFDDVRGRGDHRYDLHYQLAPAADGDSLAPAPLGNTGFGLQLNAAADSLGLWVAGSTPMAVTIERAKADPPRGWVSHRYGQRIPAPSLRARISAPPPVAFVTALLPLPGEVEVTAPLASPGAVALKIERAGGIDLALVNPGDGPATVGDLEVTGELVWLRVADRGPRRLLARNVTRVVHAGDVLFDSVVPRAWFESTRAGAEAGS